jgi:exodeoxyribonuclease-5
MMMSKDQLEAVSGIVGRIVEGKNRVAVLTGAAGTGKTFTLQHLIEQLGTVGKLNGVQWTVQLTATTNKAAKVLADSTNMEATTVYKALGITVVNKDDNSGEKTIRQKSEPYFPPHTLLVIDEASMVGNELLKYIFKVEQDNPKLFILFVGDKYQLLPVNDKCLIFNGKIPTYDLTTIHRQKGGSPIVDTATEWRQFVSGVRTELPTLRTMLDKHGSGIHVLSPKEFYSKLQEVYEMADLLYGYEGLKILSYTNKKVQKYNNFIRKLLLGEDALNTPFSVGETVVAKEPIHQRIEGSWEYEMIFHTEDSFPILEMRGPTKDRNGVEVFDVLTERYKFNSEGEREMVSVKLKAPVTAEAYARHRAIMRVDALQALAVRDQLENSGAASQDVAKAEHRRKVGWAKFFGAEQEYAQINPIYSSTVHKAQGSTYEDVFVDYMDMKQNRNLEERARLVYTALTRAKHNVYILA